MTRFTITRRGLAVLAGSAALLAAMPAMAKDKTFALVQINQQALFFNQMNEGAEAAAKAAGDTLTIFNANNDPAAQNSAIETFIQQKVDGIAVVAIDHKSIARSVGIRAAEAINVLFLDLDRLPDRLPDLRCKRRSFFACGSDRIRTSLVLFLAQF